MARAKSSKQQDFIGLMEKQILFALDDPTLTMSERISLVNAGTRLATARHKISGDDSEGDYFK